MLLVISAGIILLFGFVVLRGAPYLPTMTSKIEVSLDLLNLVPGEVLLELGSGDGSVLIAAAKRGLKGVGYELNPLLVIVSKIRCRKYKNVDIIWGDYWQKQWPDSDGLFVFLLDKYMKKLDNKVIQYKSETPYRLVSNTFEIPGKTPSKSVDGIHLYVYK
jgi:16S rRNA A1518/A1519 N6-dimethyltransferase RsmA/KsgA/DIM1 with predicted DNA glycosylase/AP lyase activity